jgi:SAM-dependent methyltransferase
MAIGLEESGNAAQFENWNTGSGRTWVQFQQQLDRQIDPLGLQAMRALVTRPGDCMLDIGCGCGQTTVQLAAGVGPSGSALGVDLSAPMLEVARARPVPPHAGTLHFQQADAQTDSLGENRFDGVYSRFGVMFFSDPVLAFSNIRGALKGQGRLAFVCWRSMSENPWMRVPMEAALPFIPAMPVPEPDAPSAFAFADRVRVRFILEEAGFSQVAVTPLDYMIGGDTPEGSLMLSMRLGPLGQALRKQPELEPLVRDPVRQALQRYLSNEGVWMPSATWIVTARKG